jgi:hypothetical protein
MSTAVSRMRSESFARCAGWGPLLRSFRRQGREASATVEFGRHYARLATAYDNPAPRRYYEKAGFEPVVESSNAPWSTSLYARKLSMCGPSAGVQTTVE